MVYIAKPIAIVIYTALAIFVIWSKLCFFCAVSMRLNKKKIYQERNKITKEEAVSVKSVILFLK